MILEPYLAQPKPYGAAIWISSLYQITCGGGGMEVEGGSVDFSASRRGGTVSHTIFGVATSAAAILTRSCVGFAKPGVPFPVCGFSMSTGAVCEKKCFANTYSKNGDTKCHQGTSKIRTPWGPQCFLKTLYVIWLDTSTWSQSPRIGNCGMWTSLPIPNARIFWYWMSGNLILLLLIPREKHQL